MRERERIDVRELVLHDIDDERREVVGGLAAGILARQGFTGRWSSPASATVRSTPPTPS